MVDNQPKIVIVKRN